MKAKIEFNKDYCCWCLIPAVGVIGYKSSIVISVVFLCFCINFKIDK